MNYLNEIEYIEEMLQEEMITPEDAIYLRERVFSDESEHDCCGFAS